MSMVCLLLAVLAVLVVSVPFGVLVLALIGAGIAEEEIVRFHLFED